jgi:hypothetical protein
MQVNRRYLCRDSEPLNAESTPPLRLPNTCWAIQCDFLAHPLLPSTVLYVKDIFRVTCYYSTYQETLFNPYQVQTFVQVVCTNITNDAGTVQRTLIDDIRHTT